jgi:hypothetical protein
MDLPQLSPCWQVTIIPVERNQLLYCYIHVFLWGRYSGQTESVLRQDLIAIAADGKLDNLIALLRQNRGDLRIQPDDFKVWSTGSRFYPLLYMLTRVYNARDWEDVPSPSIFWVRSVA